MIVGGDDDKVAMMNRTTLPTPMPMLVVMLLVMIRHDASDDIRDGGELLRVWQTLTTTLVPQSLPFVWLLHCASHHCSCCASDHDGYDMVCSWWLRCYWG